MRCDSVSLRNSSPPRYLVPAPGPRDHTLRAGAPHTPLLVEEAWAVALGIRDPGQEPGVPEATHRTQAALAPERRFSSMLEADPAEGVGLRAAGEGSGVLWKGRRFLVGWWRGLKSDLTFF